MFEVGYRYLITKPLCVGEEECRNANPTLTLGNIYEVNATISVQGLLSDPTLAERAYQLISRLRSDYPGVSINYLSVDYSDQSSTKFVVQLFDPPYRPQFVWGVVVVLLLILAVLIVSYEIIDLTIKYLPNMPKNPNFWWVVLAIAGLGVGGYLIGNLSKFRRHQ